MDAQVTGQFKEWLEQDGRYDLADRQSIEIDDAEYEKALTHCARLHPDYPPHKADAWAKFVVAAKNRVSASTREVMGGDAANSLTRSAASVETLTKEFRNFKGEFQSIASALGEVKGEVGNQTGTVTEAMSIQTKAVWIALDASAKLQDEYTERITNSVSGLTERMNKEFEAQWNHRVQMSAKERRRNIWTWLWRVALILAILSLWIPRSHAQGVTQIRAVDPSTGNPINITGVTSCATSHNCLDVNIQGVAHVICDSGCSGGGGGGGTSSNFGSAFPTAGTAIGLSNGTDMEPLVFGQQLAANSIPVVLTAAQLSTLTPLSTVAVTQSTSPWVVSNSGTFAVQATGTLTNDAAAPASTSLLGVANCVATTSAPTYTTTYIATQSCDLSGNTRVVLNAETTKVIGEVNQGTSPWIVAGGGTAGSPGTAVLTIQGVGSGTAVPVSGSFYQATQPVSCATAATCPVTATIAASQTIAVTQATASNLNATIVGAGTAGSPSGGVVSIQGVSSGTVVPVSATFNSTPQSTSTYALTSFDLAATAATEVKSTAGNVWGWYGYNPNATVCYLQFYNSTSASLGTNALHPYGIAAGASFNMAPGSMALFNLSTAISTGETTTATGGTGCGSAMVVTVLYN